MHRFESSCIATTSVPGYQAVPATQTFCRGKWNEPPSKMYSIRQVIDPNTAALTQVGGNTSSGGGYLSLTIAPASGVPEPGGILLLSLGALVLFAARRWRVRS